MSQNNDIFQELYNQLQVTEQPIQALRHYLNSIPDDDEHYNLFNILTSKLESEFEALKVVSIKSAT